MTNFIYGEGGIAFKHGPRDYFDRHRDDKGIDEPLEAPTTTGGLCHGEIIPATREKAEAYYKNHIDRAHIGSVTHFVSHSWGMNFWDILQASISHFRPYCFVS